MSACVSFRHLLQRKKQRDCMLILKHFISGVGMTTLGFPPYLGSLASPLGKRKADEERGSWRDNVWGARRVALESVAVAETPAASPAWQVQAARRMEGGAGASWASHCRRGSRFVRRVVSSRAFLGGGRPAPPSRPSPAAFPAPPPHEPSREERERCGQ